MTESKLHLVKRQWLKLNQTLLSKLPLHVGTNKTKSGSECSCFASLFLNTPDSSCPDYNTIPVFKPKWGHQHLQKPPFLVSENARVVWTQGGNVAVWMQPECEVVCCVCTWSVELCGSLEEAGQRCLQDHDEVLQLLGHSDQQILIHQVVLGLFQGPSTAHIPAHTTAREIVSSMWDNQLLH